MKTAFVCLLVFYHLTSGTGLAAQPAHVLSRNLLDCGPFQALAETDLGVPPDSFSPLFAQSIRIVSRERNIDVRLDLPQHWSPNPQIGGRRSIDGLADLWACVRSATGRTFLFLAMTCANERARTCTTGMGAPGSEWLLVYDDVGHPLISTPGVMTKADEKHLRSLGLGQVLDGGEAFARADTVYR